MPESTPNKTVSKINEEQIVNRIVELLNEKGYEYERDARPIICWKFGVKSSRELSLNQKKEVKESLENGVFEKWGMEYKEQVLDKQMDIVKEIEKLHGAPPDIKLDTKRNVAVVTDKQPKPAEPEDNAQLNKNSDVEMLKAKEDKTENKSDKKLIDASNIKIDITAQKTGKEVKEPELKPETPKINLKNSTISLKKPADKTVNEQDQKPELDNQSSKLKSISSAKEDTKVLKTAQKDENKKEPAVEKSIDVNVSEKDKLPDTGQVKDIIVNENELPQEQVAAQDTAVEGQDVSSKGKRYRLTTRGSSENNIAMGIEEAKKIVKNKFSEQSSHEEVSAATAVLVFISLSFLTISIYTNYLVLFDKNFPSWLVFICEMFR